MFHILICANNFFLFIILTFPLFQVHENGSYRSTDPIIYLNLRSLPSKTAPQTSIEYLLDYLQSSVEMFTRQRPKRVFDVNGNELKILGHLKVKQHLFISYGEDYRPAFGTIEFFVL